MSVAVDLTQPLTDGFRRRITYLRVSLTDKCNLRCVYCMPEEGLPWIPNDALLTYSEIARVVRAAARGGLRAVRITGGEPLVRPRVCELVAELASIASLDDIALSTNGILLDRFSEGLAAAGLDRINVSLDTLQEERFLAIARRPGLTRVLAGIDAALAHGMRVKVNCVVLRGRNDDELEAFADFARTRPIAVRFIELMPVHANHALGGEAYVSADEILERLQRSRQLSPVPGPPGNGPARYFSEPGALGQIGIITPLSHDYCDRCNRVRLAADGRLRLCLFGDAHVDVRAALRSGAGESEILDLLQSALEIKPERHRLHPGQTASSMLAFSEIGG